MNPQPMRAGFEPKLISLYCYNLCRLWAPTVRHFRLESAK